ncbi:MAG: FkbM family methyltransferase [bacterium]
MSFALAKWIHSRRLNRWRAYQFAATVAKRVAFRRGDDLPEPYYEVNLASLRLRIPYSLANDYLLKSHEPETMQYILRRLRQGSVFVDVGANIGYYSALAAAAVRPDGRVYAVEPSSRNLRFLVDNVQRNGLAQVKVLASAAGSSRGKARLFKGGTGVTDSLIPPDAEPLGHEDVPIVPLDEMIGGRIDLVKIDVEGAEIDVLNGMTRLIADSPGIDLIVEWNPSWLRQAGKPVCSVPDWLRAHDFMVTLLDADGAGLDQILCDLEAGRLHPRWWCNVLGRRVADGSE